MSSQPGIHCLRSPNSIDGIRDHWCNKMKPLKSYQERRLLGRYRGLLWNRNAEALPGVWKQESLGQLSPFPTLHFLSYWLQVLSSAALSIIPLCPGCTLGSSACSQPNMAATPSSKWSLTQSMFTRDRT